MTTVRILHLSDLHFSSRTAWDSEPVTRHLAHSVESLCKSGFAPDIVAITGDVAYAGSADDYSAFCEWLNKSLLPVLPDFPIANLFLIPGNHDVNRQLVSHSAIAMQSELLANASQDYIAAILQDPFDQTVLFRRFTPYLEFLRGTCPHLPGDVPWWATRRSIRGITVGVAGLCSSWLSHSDADKGRLLLSRYQVNACVGMLEGCDYTIALMHHPWSYFADSDASECRTQIRRAADMVLRGHLHEQDAHRVEDPDGSCIELAAGSAYSGALHHNAFQLIEIDHSLAELRIHYRVWHKGRWIVDRNAYERATNGVATLPLRQPSAEGSDSPLRASARRRTRSKLDTNAAHLPSPPLPNIVHTYPLQQNFTGRRAERRLLTQWLGNAQHGVMCVCAIGGMGKSALSWLWLHHDVLRQDWAVNSSLIQSPEAAFSSTHDLAGVIWWSFYEPDSGFLSFLDEAIGYFSRRRKKLKDFGSHQQAVRFVCTHLAQAPYLIVLDGFERELRAYSRLSVYQGDSFAVEDDDQHCACTNPLASRFLHEIAGQRIASKVLITTRLFPKEMHGSDGVSLPGCDKCELQELAPKDAERFFRAQGVAGSSSEIRKACEACGYHPLALRLLCGLVLFDVQSAGDIAASRRYMSRLSPRLKQKEHHILECSYEALDDHRRLLLSRIAAFRSPVRIKDIEEIAGIEVGTQAADSLTELVSRGLLFFNPTTALFDMHPVVRQYAYERLQDKAGVHTAMSRYFGSVSRDVSQSATSVEDLTPVIELYHHTIQAGQTERAFELLCERLVPVPLYSKFGAFHLCAQLLESLWDDDVESVPALASLLDQAWLMNELGNALCFSGHPSRGVKCLEWALGVYRSESHLRNELTVLANLASQQTLLGRFNAAHLSVRRCLELSDVLKDPEKKALALRLLAQLVLYRDASDDALGHYEAALELCKVRKNALGYGITLTGLAICQAILGRSASAFKNASRSLAVLKRRGGEREVFQAHLAVGSVSLLHGNRSPKHLERAERHLLEAVMGGRNRGMVSIEAEGLLYLARLYALRGDETLAEETALDALHASERYTVKKLDALCVLAMLAQKAGDRRASVLLAQCRALASTATDGPPYQLAIRCCEEVESSSIVPI